MYNIQTNASGTRSMEISEVNLQTIQKYSLFQHLIDSNGIVDESVLDKLKLNIRSLIASAEGSADGMNSMSSCSVAMHTWTIPRSERL